MQNPRPTHSALPRLFQLHVNKTPGDVQTNAGFPDAVCVQACLEHTGAAPVVLKLCSTSETLGNFKYADAQARHRAD